MISHVSAGVVVLGMHRSGTSAVTRVVNLLGIPLGRKEDQMPSTHDNPKGYWESVALSSFNDELIKHLGGSWAGLPALCPGWEDQPELTSWIDRARDIFEHVHAGPFWVWKDPRVCVTLPFWRRALAGSRIAVVLVHRHPLEISGSLERRDGFSRSLGVALWERSLREALRGCKGLPVLALRYADLLGQPEDVVQSLSSFLSAQGFPIHDPLPMDRVIDHLDAGLRHTKFDPGEFEALELASSQQKSLFRSLENMIGSSDDFQPPELPEETDWVALLLEERSKGDLREASILLEAQELHDRLGAEQHERARVERSLGRAVDMIQALGLVQTDAQEEEESEEPVPRYGPDAEQDLERYRVWLHERCGMRKQRVCELTTKIARSNENQMFTFLTVFRNVRPAIFSALVESLRAQPEGSWELRVAIPAGEVQGAVLSLGGILDDRVSFCEGAWAGDAAALNAAASAARGQWIGVVGVHDVLEEGAIAELAAAVGEETADLVYGDEDRIDPKGTRFAPFFKPDWSPDYLLSTNYIGRPWVIRREIFNKLEGFRAELEGAHEYDLLLRSAEQARKIAHVREVILHRRSIPAEPVESAEASAKAVEEALVRRREEGVVQAGLVGGTLRVRRAVRGRPLVSVVIPFRDQASLTARCVESLQASGWDNWEALLVDNRSWEPETRALIEHLSEDPRCRFLEHDAPFNWSAINNRAAEVARGDLLLFLNNDVDSGCVGWLKEMISHAQRPEVGAVGARLLYPTGQAQHAGVMLGPGGIAGHAFRLLPRMDPGYYGMSLVVREWSAVTGACLMVRRELFRELEGFDESFAVAYNDIDFCLRLRQRNYRVVYTPFADLVHHESLTRGVSTDRPEAREMFHRWRNEIEHDPFYHPHLSRIRESFSLPAEDEEKPWQKILSILES